MAVDHVPPLQATSALHHTLERQESIAKHHFLKEPAAWLGWQTCSLKREWCRVEGCLLVMAMSEQAQQTRMEIHTQEGKK